MFEVKALRGEGARYPISHFLLILFLVLAAFRNLVDVHLQSIDLLYSYVDNILGGVPPYKVFQNRLIAPMLVKLAEWGLIPIFSIMSPKVLQNPLKISYMSVILAVLLASHYLAYVLFYRKMENRQRALAYTVVFNFMFIIFQSSILLFIWDIVELPFALLFAYGVFQKKKCSYFLPLFFLSLFVREMALAIPFWIALDSFSWESDSAKPRFFRFKLMNVRQALLGISLIVLGVVVTKYVRDIMFIVSSKDGVGLDVENQLLGNWFQFVNNVKVMFIGNVLESINPRFLIENQPMTVLTSFIPIIILYVLFANTKQATAHSMKTMVMVLAFFVAIFFFGYIRETREWLYLIPFILFYYMDFCDSRSPIHR